MPDLNIETTPDGTCVITLQGELTLKHHAAMHGMLRDVTTPAQTIRLEISQPSAIDLCFLQLLHAFIQSAAQQGKTVHVNATLAEADQKLIARTGFHTLLYTTLNS